MRRFTDWTSKPKPLRDPQWAGPVVECHVAGCGDTAQWWRTVNDARSLGACLCDAHRDALLVSWTMPPYPPVVIVSEQLTIPEAS